MICNIEIFIDGRWQPAAEFKCSEGHDAAGHRGAGIFSYSPEFIIEHNLGHPEHQASVQYPVDFNYHVLDNWPAFLLDLMPSGAARRTVLSELNIPLADDGKVHDWEVLLQGSANPIGNLRIKQSVKRFAQNQHPGFDRQDIVDRNEDFIEYARSQGAPVSGSSGLQGDAPKFMLVEDFNGKWHANNAITDEHVKQHWIVKFPRGKDETDRQILKNEAAYYCVAEALGLHTGRLIEYENDALFIPRFDREIVDGELKYYGVESFCSAMGIAEFGAHPPLERWISTIIKYCSNPQSDVEIFMMRDIANIVMGNTDNHPRNTAFIKKHGVVSLSPLYDFAPMFLDKAGIARSCRWGKLDLSFSTDWGEVIALPVFEQIDRRSLVQRLQNFAEKLKQLPETMQKAGVDAFLIDRITVRNNEVIAKLLTIS